MLFSSEIRPILHKKSETYNMSHFYITNIIQLILSTNPMMTDCAL